MSFLFGLFSQPLNYLKQTLRNVSQMATATHVGHKATEIKFIKATNGAEHIAAVTPMVVRMRPYNSRERRHPKCQSMTDFLDRLASYTGKNPKHRGRLVHDNTNNSNDNYS